MTGVSVLCGFSLAGMTREGFNDGVSLVLSMTLLMTTKSSSTTLLNNTSLSIDLVTQYFSKFTQYWS